MLIVVGVSMLAAPVVARLGQSLGDTSTDASRRRPEEDAELGELGGHVIIAGYGRVGQLVGQMLEEQGRGLRRHREQCPAHRPPAQGRRAAGVRRRQPPGALRKLRLDQARAVGADHGPHRRRDPRGYMASAAWCR